MVRVVLAFVVIPFIYPLHGFLFSGELSSDVGARLVLRVASITIPVTIVIGVPLFLLFRRRNWLQWWHFLVGGSVVGIACSLPILPRVGAWEFVAVFALSFAIIGLLHGIGFWLLAVWRNPGLTSRSKTDAPPAGGAPLS